MKRPMRGSLHLTERNKTNVRLAHLFERPANGHVTRQSPAAIGRPFKRGDGGGHWKVPDDCLTRSCVAECFVSKDDTLARPEPSQQSVSGHAYNRYLAGSATGSASRCHVRFRLANRIGRRAAMGAELSPSGRKQPVRFPAR